MSGPLVSVLIPTYNSERFIENTLRSALGQTHTNIEVVILDDGSMDETPSMIKRLSQNDSRIRYVFQENHGLAQARNRLVSLAKGEYISFLDHDDEWLIDKIEVLLEAFRHKPNAAMIYGDVINRCADKKESRAFEFRRPRRGSVFYEYLLEGNFMSLPSVLIKKDALVKYLPFDPRYKIALDWDLFLRIVRNHEIDYVDRVVGIYNTHNERFTAKNPIVEIEEVLQVLDFWANKDPKILSSYKSKFLKAKTKVNLQRINYVCSKKEKMHILTRHIRSNLFCFAAYIRLIRLVFKKES